MLYSFTNTSAAFTCHQFILRTIAQLRERDQAAARIATSLIGDLRTRYRTHNNATSTAFSAFRHLELRCTILLLPSKLSLGGNKTRTCCTAISSATTTLKNKSGAIDNGWNRLTVSSQQLARLPVFVRRQSKSMRGNYLRCTAARRKPISASAFTINTYASSR